MSIDRWALRRLVAASLVVLVAACGPGVSERPSKTTPSAQVLSLSGSAWLVTRLVDDTGSHRINGLTNTPRIRPGIHISIPFQPWIKFNSVEYEGSDGCNGSGGTYAQSGSRLALDTRWHTQIGCNQELVGPSDRVDALLGGETEIVEIGSSDGDREIKLVFKRGSLFLRQVAPVSEPAPELEEAVSDAQAFAARKGTYVGFAKREGLPAYRPARKDNPTVDLETKKGIIMSMLTEHGPMCASVVVADRHTTTEYFSVDAWAPSEWGASNLSGPC